MKYLTVTPFKEFGKFPKMSGDHRFSSAIARLAARSSNSLTQHQRQMTKEHTLPPALYPTLQFNKSLYSSP
jgi:hypothetical protein